jgi:hypothetical protein
MPTGRRPITESATRFESERAAPRVKLEYYPSPRLGRHPNWTWCLLSYCTDIRFLQLVVDYRLTPPSLDRWGIPPAAALIRWVCNDFERRHLRTTPELRAIPKGLELADRREVMMSMSEYEEGFRRNVLTASNLRRDRGDPTGDDNGLDASGLLRPWSENGHLLGLLIFQPFQLRRPRGLSGPETAGLRPRGQ